MTAVYNQQPLSSGFVGFIKSALNKTLSLERMLFKELGGLLKSEMSQRYLSSNFIQVFHNNAQVHTDP